jgi:diadenosine tetraphosphatase ApaH/serine/threonine PP2A family protein phosphatase
LAYYDGGIQGERDGIWAWQRINQLFNWLPLAALIEKKIICMHGGIGRSINHVQQIEALQRPITMEAGSVVLMDLLWSDPTENDSVEGLRPNARGPGLVTFGPDRVMDFCKNNDLQLIIRAHECVMDGFERFAQGHLITLFSATNYCGTANNAGAILVLGRDLVVVPKLIHPIPPAFTSPESSPEHNLEDTWMQVFLSWFFCTGLLASLVNEIYWCYISRWLGCVFASCCMPQFPSLKPLPCFFWVCFLILTRRSVCVGMYIGTECAEASYTNKRTATTSE